MVSRDQILEPLARRRTDEVVVTTMSVVRPWGSYSDHDLDFASADSAMGHAADLALGVAMAQPERTVICLNGDGSMLMSLGTLVTIIESGVTNLILFVAVNRTYEITGNQPIPAAERVDFAAIARGPGSSACSSSTSPMGTSSGSMTSSRLPARPSSACTASPVRKAPSTVSRKSTRATCRFRSPIGACRCDGS